MKKAEKQKRRARKGKMSELAGDRPIKLVEALEALLKLDGDSMAEMKALDAKTGALGTVAHRFATKARARQRPQGRQLYQETCDVTNNTALEWALRPPRHGEAVYLAVFGDSESVEVVLS